MRSLTAEDAFRFVFKPIQLTRAVFQIISQESVFKGVHKLLITFQTTQREDVYFSVQKVH